MFQAFFGIARDATERKRIETALQHKNEEMERFIAIVSHDLRSPLVTIKAFLSLLEGSIELGEKEQIAKDIDFIRVASDHMERLLAALLQLSRVEQAQTTLETMTATQIIENTLTLLSGSIQLHQVKLKVDCSPVPLHGDPMQMGLIWQNLIENSVKYMGSQVEPVIEIGSQAQQGHIIFYVRDNGIGISPKSLDKIFSLFFQQNKKAEGVGLGLALVKKLVSLYGGNVWAESEGSGKGSCFYFTLPQALKSGL